MKHPHHGPDMKNLLIALVLATAIMGSWQYFFERPRLEAARLEQAAAVKAKAKAEAAPKLAAPKHITVAAAEAGPRIAIESPSLKGSLTGSRIDTLILPKYRNTREKDSGAVELLKPADEDDAYFTEIGVLGNAGVAVPNAQTPWQADGTRLTPQTPVTLRWDNGAGLSFEKKIAVDEHYMFTVTTAVRNNGAAPVTLYPYGLVSRTYEDTSKHYLIMHEGPLGVADEVLHDIAYQDLREDGPQQFKHTKGWIGLTDKYWLSALIPPADMRFDANFKHFKRAGRDAYQVDLRGEELVVEPGQAGEFTLRVFAGAKEVKLLDAYRTEFNIPLFDRAVDFGSLYFLTKPIFFVLSYFYGLVGNFGVAILLLVVCIKILLYPLANKSYTAMSHMKLLMPQMTEIKERYADDKLKMNQAVMEMYKKEKVNPMSGCLPILIQIPVFFALYRVLFTTIEMRHAPFFGWINDLSAPDPTTVFNLFGLIPWDPSTVPLVGSFLMIGVWPLIMCVTMVLQQKLNPKPTDPVQAQVIAYMPYVFLFLFASFPAGLVIYWAWNNVLSIFQQLLIQQKLKKKGHKKH